MRIGRTTFNREAVGKMTQSQFVKTYKPILKLSVEDLKAMYRKVTGKGEESGEENEQSYD